MPTVIGINQVPQGFPPQPGFWGGLGQLGGTMTRQVTDALLRALLSGGGGLGPVPTSPTSRNPGTFNFPPGSQSPGEAAQIQQMGGVPTRGQPFLSRATQQPGTGGVSYTQPTRLGIRPDVDFQLRQAQLQKAQQGLDPNSLDNQFVREITAKMQRERQAPQSPGGFYNVGDIVERAGKRWRVVGIDTDGMPLVEEE